MEKQPLQAAGWRRRAANLKGQFMKKKEAPSRPKGLARVLEFVFRLALIWRRQRSGVSVALQDGTDSALKLKLMVL